MAPAGLEFSWSPAQGVGEPGLTSQADKAQPPNVPPAGALGPVPVRIVSPGTLPLPAGLVYFFWAFLARIPTVLPPCLPADSQLHSSAGPNATQSPWSVSLAGFSEPLPQLPAEWKGFPGQGLLQTPTATQGPQAAASDPLQAASNRPVTPGTGTQEGALPPLEASAAGSVVASEAQTQCCHFSGGGRLGVRFSLRTRCARQLRLRAALARVLTHGSGSA